MTIKPRNKLRTFSTLPDAAAFAPDHEIIHKGEVLKTDGKMWLSDTNSRVIGKPKLCFVGSSLTQQGNGITPTKISTDSRGWPAWLMCMLQDSAVAEQWQYTGPDAELYSVGSNRGFSGQFAKAIDARKADIAAMDADIYIIQQGTNDLSSTDVVTTISYVYSTARYLRDSGAIVVLLTEPPRNFSATGWESGGAAQKRRDVLNQAKRALAASERGIYCVESDKYLITATGEPKANYNYDGTHFSTTGAYWFAMAVYECLKTFIPLLPKMINQQAVYDATYNTNGNLIGNPTLQNSANGFTKSALPTGVTAFNVVNNSDGTVTITITTDGTGTAGAATSCYLSYAAPITLAKDQAVKCAVKIKSVTQADNLYAIRSYVRASKSGETSTYAYGMEKYLSSSYPNSKTTYWPVQSTEMVNKTPALVVPFDGATITNALYIDVNAGVSGTNIITLEGIDARVVPLPWVAAGVKQDTGYASQNYYGGTDI